MHLGYEKEEEKEKEKKKKGGQKKRRKQKCNGFILPLKLPMEAFKQVKRKHCRNSNKSFNEPTFLKQCPLLPVAELTYVFNSPLKKDRYV